LRRCELDGVPGFVPRLLRDPGIGLFRSDERVFEAMLHGWRAQMLARGLVPAGDDQGALRGGVAFPGFHW
jgi:integrase/recombinase XerD